jgi:hypothetical protein
LIALVRAAQEQDSIREQTQALEERRLLADQYLDDAGKLAELEAALADSIAQLAQKTPIEEAKPLLGKVSELMSENALKLGAPQTDAAVVADQSMIIEILIPPDKKSGKQQSSAMAKMQQAAQKMMAKGQKPGRGNNKADSNMMAANATGAAVKDQANQRVIDKSSGAGNTGDWPAEFRDELQAYFNNLEAPEQK